MTQPKEPSATDPAKRVVLPDSGLGWTLYLFYDAGGRCNAAYRIYKNGTREDVIGLDLELLRKML